MVYAELDEKKNLIVWFLVYDEKFKIGNVAMRLGVSPANWKPSDIELFSLLQMRLNGNDPERIVRQMAKLLIRYGYEVRNIRPKKPRGCSSCGKRRRKK